jgi:Gram-negative porin
MHRQGTMAKALAAVSAAVLLCAAPAAAQSFKKPAATQKAEPKRKLTASSSSSAVSLRPDTLGSFTPPMLDTAKRAPGSLSASVQERSFRFTPSGKARDRKALALGVTSRVVRPAAPEVARPVETASAYNVDVSVALAGFAITGGISKLDSVLQQEREGVDLGLSYRGNRWKTALQLNADRDADGWISPLGIDKRYSVELGGAYALTPRLSVMGGVRYQMMQPDDASRYLLRGTGTADDAEAGAVYLGTAISF